MKSAGIDELVARPSAWLGDGKRSGIVVSCRVRVARNVHGESFPCWMQEPDRIRLWKKLSASLAELPSMVDPLVFEMGELQWCDKQVLKERHLISVEECEKGAGSGVVLRGDESMSVMVNEEDHLRIQAMSPGSNLERLWKLVDRADTELERVVRYAFSERLGYLTACPSNVGTGLRASVMLHLPGLGLLNETEPVTKGLVRIGFAVRGLLGEGSDASGNMFQISNQRTLGECEADIINRLSEAVAEIVGHEKNARARLIEQRREYVGDFVGRSVGILTNAHLLSSRELLDLLSGLRLGRDLGMIRNIATSTMYELILLTQPGHMLKITAKDLTPEKRDEMRAQLVRSRLAGMTAQV